MKCLLPLLLIIVFSHSISQAQSIVSGKVQDKTKANPLQDASIQLLNLKDSTVRSAKSNDKGAFSFERVNPGKYQISGTLLGFKKFEQQLDVNKATQSVMVELEPGGNNN
ncbi:carboxypeptidase-like regulatory domain-containing protein [Sphingobacterium daejeonense]|jgi:uncharacterized protein YfaS (alpha-2-macroglobulin family)|uniref:carboxypeptidase-like regulatory domain-containing protein n=1 Tax=Sphingobacterium daejeonense TaxID=371142 RepID=UPI0010C2AC48|nr:carboxypeptidase-like regulatory domain-containing protein [Sphingobacterium daejeonense]VTP87893.1 Uncharacterised protein [Sphingobacterium daejeonense]